MRIWQALLMVVALGAGAFDKTGPAMLEGSAWRGVTLTSPSGEVVEGSTKDYQLEFLDDGGAHLKLDCNSAGGSYTAREHAAGQGDLVFGALRMTRAKCPPQSLSPVIAAQLGAVKGYKIEGHALILTLDNGGTLVWQLAR